MAETMALAAVRPLLGLIRNEARLLRGVRGDVRFINDEMESVKGFLLTLQARTARDGAHGNHQVRAWLQQVMDIAFDSKNCVEDYAKSGRMSPGDGRWALTRRIKWGVLLLRRLLARRRIAARIRKLKVRVREVSERQQRYAVADDAPPPPGTTTTTNPTAAVDWNSPGGGRGAVHQGPRRQSTHPGKDSPRWAVVSGPDILTEATRELLRWLELKPEDYHTRPWPSVLAVVTADGVDGASLADQLYKHCKSDSDDDDLKLKLKFDCAVRIKIPRPPFQLQLILVDMLRHLHPEDDYFIRSTGQGGVKKWDLLAKITEKLKVFLRGKRLLLVFSGLDYPGIWDDIKRSLKEMECSAGSAVVFTTKEEQLADECSPDESKVYSLVDFYSKKALTLLPSNYRSREDKHLRRTIRRILRGCAQDLYCINLLLHALLSNPNRTVQELESLYRSLETTQCSTEIDTKIEKQKRMITFCYHGLCQDYQNCLWYTTVFTRGIFKVRRASLLRRWVAEGLITGGGGGQLMNSATDEAERCFNALLTQKLLLSREDGGTGKIKSCGPNVLLTPVITDDATTADEAFLDTNELPDDLQLHFSIRNGILLRSTGSIINSPKKKISNKTTTTTTERQMTSIMAFLKSLPSSSSFRLLRVLDLEGFRGFKKRHLNSICKIHQLKYLCLRDTDVVELPKEIEHLLQLETLDIRGTKVRRLKALLPMLKHLLAGRIHYRSSGQGGGGGDTTTVKDNQLFTTVRLPADVSKMENLEILSHVQVYNDSGKDLIHVGDRLKKLRKLGVVLSGNKANQLDGLFREIDELDNKRLVSLSIRVEPPVNWDTVNGAALTLPRLLESLTICGVRSWLPVKELDRLVKITLRDTKLKASDLDILGSLGSLLCLRLRYHSFSEAALVFGQGQFGKLMELVIEDDSLRRLYFDARTAPKLTTMVWSFTRMESISGIKNLVSLRRLELNRGRCDPAGLGKLQQDISAHCNRVRFSLNPPAENNQGLAGGDAAATAPSYS